MEKYSKLPVNELKGLGLLNTNFLYDSKKEIRDVKYHGSLGKLPLEGSAYLD